MARRQELVVVIGADDRKFKAAIKRVKGVALNVGKALAVATGAAGIFSVREAMKFERGMAEVNTIAGLGAAQFNRLKIGVRGVAQELGLGLMDSVKGLYDAVSAGIPADNAIDFLRVAGKSAVAGVTTMSVAVDGLTSILNAFGLQATEAQRVSDLMFTVVKDGKITYEQLAQGIGKVAPIAKTAGLSFEQLSAYVAALVKVEQPERAMSALAASIRWAAKNGKTLDEVLARFEGKDLTKILRAGVGEEAAKGISILAGNMESVRSEQESMAASAGATERAYAIVAATSPQQLAIMQAKLRDMAITAGDALLPAVREIMKQLDGFIGSAESANAFRETMLSVAEVVNGLVTAMKWFFAFTGLVGKGLENVYQIMLRILEVRNKLVNVMTFGKFGNETAETMTRRTSGEAITDAQLRAARIAKARGFSMDNTSPMAFNAILTKILEELQGEGKTWGMAGMPAPQGAQ